MTLPLPEQLEADLKAEAARRGISASELAAQLLRERLPRDSGDAATLQLLADWDREDATSDATQIQQRRTQFEQFKSGMNESAMSERKVYP